MKDKMISYLKKNLISIIILLLIGVYVVFANYCAWLFMNDKISYNGFDLYSRHEIDKESAKIILDNVENKLSKIGDDFKKVPKQEIYILNNTILSRFFNSLSSGLAFTQRISKKIYISNCNIENNIVLDSNRNKTNRTVTGVVVHEMIHVMMIEKLGNIEFFKLPFYISEGYPEYISGESTLNINDGINMIKNKSNDTSNKYKYFKARMAIIYLIEIEKKDLSELIKLKLDQDEVYKKVENNIDKISEIINDKN